jgi:hypothetical protein
MTTHIGHRPTSEMYGPGLEIDCQCARCGSSMDYERCCECDGDGLVEKDFGDDVVPDYHLRPCEVCDGLGGWYRCMSSPEWCQANPLPGREKVPRGTIEWFTVPRED